jgi:zinc protease
VYFGDYKKLYQAPAEYNKVSAADIQAVAKKYFKKSNRTIGVVQSNVEQ